MTHRKTHQQANRPQKKSHTLALGIILGIAVLIAAVVIILLQNGDDEDVSVSASLPANISVQQAVEKRDQGALIVDVRQPNEWAEYHIPDSTLIPLDQLSSRLSEIPQDQEVVVVCRSGNRSAQARDILLAAGYTQVTSMNGGLLEWRDQGYPTESGS